MVSMKAACVHNEVLNRQRGRERSYNELNEAIRIVSAHGSKIKVSQGDFNVLQTISKSGFKDDLESNRKKLDKLDIIFKKTLGPDLPSFHEIWATLGYTEHLVKAFLDVCVVDKTLGRAAPMSESIQK